MTFLDHIKSILGLVPEKLFYPSQEITPISSPNWAEHISKKPALGPKFGQIVRVRRYEQLHKGRWYISIGGYTNFYDELEFAPVISDDELEEMLNEVDELVIKHHE